MGVVVCRGVCRRERCVATCGGDVRVCAGANGAVWQRAAAGRFCVPACGRAAAACAVCFEGRASPRALFLQRFARLRVSGVYAPQAAAPPRCRRQSSSRRCESYQNRGHVSVVRLSSARPSRVFIKPPSSSVDILASLAVSKHPEDVFGARQFNTGPQRRLAKIHRGLRDLVDKAQRLAKNSIATALAVP